MPHPGSPFLALLVLVLPAGARAQPVGAPPAAPPTPAPYSLPWLLRPAVPATVVRLDETVAFHEDPVSGRHGETYVTSLVATYRVSPRWVPILRAMWVKESAAAGASGSGFSNPVVGVNYFRPLGKNWRLAAFGASSIPIGSGGGDTPDPGAAAAVAAGIPARSGMDNTLFAVNYWGLVGGIGVARLTRALTLQAEMTLFQLTRVRGPESQDESRTNLTAALHAGHFFTPKVSLGAEVRMQRWLSDAAPVRANPAARTQLTFGVGPRFHLKAGRRTVRPGISYSRAFDDPMAAKGYDILQVDVPVAF